jgi:hypothetical protein
VVGEVRWLDGDLEGVVVGEVRWLDGIEQTSGIGQ